MTLTLNAALTTATLWFSVGWINSFVSIGKLARIWGETWGLFLFLKTAFFAFWCGRHKRIYRVGGGTPPENKKGHHHHPQKIEVLVSGWGGLPIRSRIFFFFCRIGPLKNYRKNPPMVEESEEEKIEDDLKILLYFEI